MYCIFLRENEFKLLRTLLSHLEEILWWNKPYITERKVLCSYELELVQEEIRAFGEILRSVNRAARKYADKRRKTSYNR